MGLMVLSQREVRQCIDMEQAIKVMENAFTEYYRGQAVLPLRTSVRIEKENASTLTMPAYLSQQNSLGLKVVSIFPNNVAINKPIINGVLLLLNELTGEALAIMEAGYLTALRTGAVSGLATQLLASEDASHVAIIGSGVQALTQLEAMACVRPIKEVSVWSRDFENCRAFAQKVQAQYDVDCHQNISDAVKNADIICTATPSEIPLISIKDLKERVHVNAVGSHAPGMNEVHNDVIAKATVVVDQVEAAMAEAGEIISALKANCIRKEDLIELGLLAIKGPLQNMRNITVFKSVGLAIQDISIAHEVYLNALKKGLGTSISLL